MLESSDLVAMTAAKKADLFEAAARRMTEDRYDASIILASLQRSNGYLDLHCKTVEELAWKRSKLPHRDVIDMLRVGRKLLDIPELDRAFKDGLLCWSKVRALVPLITRDNAAEWIAKAIGLTSNNLERQISNQRDPCIGGGPTQVMILSLPGYRRFEEVANALRREAGDKHVTNEECLMRVLDEFEASREAGRTDRTAGASAARSAPVPAAQASVTAPSAVEELAVPVEPCATRSRHIPTAIREKVMNRARHACEAKGCRNRFGLEVHHVKKFRDGGLHTLSNLMVLCHRCHVKRHEEERRVARAPVAAREQATREARPLREEKSPDKGQHELTTGTSVRSPAHDSDDLVRPGSTAPAKPCGASPFGDAKPLGASTRLDPARRNGAGTDAPGTKQAASGEPPGGP